MEDLESLLFGLLFLGVVGFQVLKQFLAARAEQRRRLEQARARAGMPPSPQDAQIDSDSDSDSDFESGLPELGGSDWGRAPVPQTVAELPLEVQQALQHKPARSRDGLPTGQVQRPATKLARGRARHHLFHSRRALRHGIVMMTVLGPCRALRPYDGDQ